MKRKRREEGQKMHTFSSVCRLLLWDWTTLLFFELTYKFLLIFLTPYFQDILSYAMRRAGMSVSYTHLTLPTTPYV